MVIVRIIKANIDKFKEQGTIGNQQMVASNQQTTSDEAKVSKPAATPAYTAPVVMGQEGFTDIPNSQMRNVIAKRLCESKFSAPHFYLTMEINMDNAIAARIQLNEISPVKNPF